MRILYIARYHTVTAERKIALLASEPDMDVWLVRPRRWRDDYGSSNLPVRAGQPYHTVAVPLAFRPGDPHRCLYGTLSFAMPSARPDIIHVEEEPDSLAALQVAAARRLLAPRARLVLNTWQNVDRAKGREVWWVLRTTLGQADAILCASREAQALLRSFGYRGDTRVLPPQGIDLDVFYPRRHEPAADGAPFTVVYVGRLVPEKGVNLLIDAVGALDGSCRLVLIGGGPSRASLEARACERGLEGCVQFAGALSPMELAEHLRRSDVLVLPSLSTPVWKEQFGRALVEAMACGLPVVGSDSGAIPEVVGDAGLIFREGDVSALTGCLERLAASPELRVELGERGRLRVNRMYSQERIAARTAAFYRLLLEKRDDQDD
jgi:glycosyltransferase involved in cell wall biosynthesis